MLKDISKSLPGDILGQKNARMCSSGSNEITALTSFILAKTSVSRSKECNDKHSPLTRFLTSSQQSSRSFFKLSELQLTYPCEPSWKTHLIK